MTNNRKVLSLILLVILLFSLSACSNSEDTTTAKQETRQDTGITIKAGDHINFGLFPQYSSGTDQTPIEWLVLDVDRGANKALLISQYGLDMLAYMSEYSSRANRWESSTLRRWLNGSFIKNAFTRKEQQAILLTDIDNSSSQGNNSKESSNAQDRVFILSYAEAEKYFANNSARVCVNTPYADTKRNKTGNCDWWLRSPGEYSDCVALVADDGSIGSWSFGIASSHRAVRPAMWVDIASLQKLNVSEDIIMPSLGKALLIPANKDYTMSDGSRCIVYEHISTDDFDKYYQYCAGFNFDESEKKQDGDIYTFILKKGETNLTITYDMKTGLTTVVYPVGTVCEEYDYVGYEKIYNTITDTIVLGHYPQSADGSDFTPIEWAVLDIDGKENKVLLISQYALDGQPYNTTNGNITWADSSLRTWMNEEFFKKAFSEAEQNMILTTNVAVGADIGTDTQDKVFLLSTEEAGKYFTNISDMRCLATEYTASQGVSLGVSALNGRSFCTWRLRSPGEEINSVNIIGHDGWCYDDVDITCSEGIRPVIWLDFGQLTDENMVGETVAERQTPVDDFKTVGNHVKFGRFSQSVGSSTIKPIEWIVLDYDEEADRALLLSQYALDEERYNGEEYSVTWETSGIRRWLNNSFIATAFNTNECNALVTITVLADESPTDNNSSGKNTRDKIFLLSKDEVYQYLPDPQSRICIPTEYTQYIHQMSNGYRGYKLKMDETSIYWWLRTIQHRAQVGCIDNNGALSLKPGTKGNVEAGVRPAIWVDCGVIAGEKAIADEAPEIVVDTNENEVTVDDDAVDDTADKKNPEGETKPEEFKIIGSFVTFGHYPQTANGNDHTPIEWIVLNYDEETNQAMLLSHYALDAQRMTDPQKGGNYDWYSRTLPAWLNGTFFDNAFIEQEQEMIITVSDWRKDGKANLLSSSEFSQYVESTEAGKCIPTEYAVAHGAAKGGETGTCCWWIADKGYNFNDSDYDLGPETAMNITTDGSCDSSGKDVSSVQAVRPVIIVDCGLLFSNNGQ